MVSSKLKIVADENIPFAQEAFGTLGTVQCYPGRRLTPAVVRKADVLLVRSVTRVDRSLQAGSRVRFVGSATIGTDHVDRQYLREQGIAFAHAPGSNADSVVEYVVAALLSLAVRRTRPLRGMTIGVVGCGHIGGRLAERLPAFGIHVLKNDPPLARRADAEGRPHDFVSLEHVMADADALTLHVPLTHEGLHATHHLIDTAAMQHLKPDAWLLNTSRGSVVANEALAEMLERGRLGAAVLDVWEHEPTPHLDLLSRVDLATPHIAGYSHDGKVQGTIMLYQALTDFLDVEPTWDYNAVLAPAPEDRLTLSPPPASLAESTWLHRLVRQMYDIDADDQRLRDIVQLPADERGAYFSKLRKQYPRRRTFARHRIARPEVPERYRTVVEQGLRVRLIDDPDGTTRKV